MTKEQLKTYQRCMKDGCFRFPCCGSTIVNNFPQIENPNDSSSTKTQIYCHYGCGFIYLEDYLKPE